MMMKKSFIFGIGIWTALAVGFLSSASAEDAAGNSAPSARIALLVNEETVLATRVNIAQFDPEQVGEILKSVFHSYLTLMKFDEESIARTEKEFNITVSRLTMIGTGFIADFKNRTKVNEFWLLCKKPTKEDRNGPPFCLVTPLGDKKEPEIDALRDMLSGFVIEPIGDFLFAVPDVHEDWLDEYKNFQPSENRVISDGLISGADATIVMALAPFDWDGLFKEMEGEDLFEAAKEAPVPIIPLMTVFKNSFQGATLQVDLNRVTSEIEVVFANKRAAASVRDELEKLIDAFVVLIRENVAQEIQEENEDAAAFINMLNLSPLFLEILRGRLRTALPVQEENRLLFSDNAEEGEVSSIMPGNVAVAGIAVGILLPAIQSARAAAKRMQCVNNLKQMALAFHNFHDVYDCLPPAYSVDQEGKPLHSWRVLILPFIEEIDLYEKIHLDEPWDSEWNSQFHSQMPALYDCPDASDDGGDEGLTHYSAILGKETVFPPITRGNPDGKEKLQFGGTSLAHIIDGTSNTLMLVERKKAVCWMDPTQEFEFESLENGFDPNADDSLLGPHRGGTNVARVDGSVLFLSDTTQPVVLKALATCAGGESVDLE